VKFLGRGDTLMINNSKYCTPTVSSCTVSPTEIISNTKAMHIHGTHPITDQGNNFMSHIATVNNPIEVSMAISAVKHTNNKGTSSATHNMYAARVLVNGKLTEFTEDDGEYGGSRRILQEMQYSNIVNRVVVVSRWCSGTQLGPKRFNVISQCVKAAIQKDYKSNAETQVTTRIATPPEMDPQMTPPAATRLPISENATKYSFTPPIQVIKGHTQPAAR